MIWRILRGRSPRFGDSRFGTGRPGGQASCWRSELVWVMAATLSLASAASSLAGTLQPRLARLLEMHSALNSGSSPSDSDPGGLASRHYVDSGIGRPLLGGVIETPNGRWRLQLLVTPEASLGEGRSRLSEALSSLDVELRGQPWNGEPRVWEVEVPPERLFELGRLEEVTHVGQLLGPLVPPGGDRGGALEFQTAFPSSAHTGSVESQALEQMKVPEAHGLGYRGRSIRVGIVDVGFDGYLPRVGSELPSRVTFRNFTDAAVSTQSHGTACAEVIADIAPEAELFLAEIASSLDLQEAVDWFVEEQVEVMSHSLAWFLGGGDGTGPIVEMTQRAAEDGIHWITSSGNFRRSYWRGESRDRNDDGWIDTGTTNGRGVRMAGGSGSISLILSWDRWPLSESVSFQIDVYDGQVLLGSSETEYGDDYPFAFRELTIPTGNWVAPEFRIRSDRGDPADVRLRVFRVDQTPGFLEAADRVEAGSLAVPADSPWVLSVGAYSYRSTTLEPFSSYGPTGSGLAKPDLIAADAVSTSLPRYSAFVGTSASCPHVAGAVALLLSADVEGGAFDLHWSRDDVAALLRSAAEPLPSVEEAEQGWGQLRLPLSPPEAARSPLTLLRSGPEGVTIHLRRAGGGAAEPLRIFDVRGRYLTSVPPRSAPGPGTAPGTRASPARDGGGDPAPLPHSPLTSGVEYELSTSGISLRSGRYWARDPWSGASLPFLWIR